ncbi:peptidyl-prolyl cis-trans isomerase [Salibaculum sp.]|uniref:peptidyl-prolyl cis-trans isomerase n=1 Tax=Salibaculum sp. TaxID=2855480 RepID=UPI002B49AF2D|nr:peptidyl-prolyl cis-trans isomerase [Salibaculum sp.]HKL69256.1 peptidyl-prolyl cis-trans isomerase [Salibaculum sp.]
MADGSKKNRPFVWIVIGLLMFGMVGFGATGLTGRVSSIGTVGALEVPVSAYSQELQGRIQSLSAQADEPLSFAQARERGVPDQALQQVIRSRVLDNEMRQLGVSVGDESVRREVLDTLAFAGPDGNFDREQYRAVLRDNGLTEEQYESRIRDDSARALLQGAVISGLPSPEVYAKTVAAYIGEERDFTWDTLTPQDLQASLPDPTDADLRAHYEANPEAYTAPETRMLTYAWLTPDMIQEQITVDEAELRQAYEDRLDEFVQPERRLVERLSFGTREAAQEALDRIEAGDTDFEALVAERGLDLADVDLGDVSRDSLSQAGRAVFDAETGDVVGPQPSPLGPALFRVNAVLAAQETTFDEARPRLREDRAAARARRVIEDQIEPITDLLAGGARLADLAEQTDMQLGDMAWTPQVRDGVAAYAGFREVVAGLDLGTFPELHELEGGGLFAVRVNEVRPPELQPFDAVRAEVAEDWRAAETRRQLRARAEEIAEDIDTETEFTQVGLDGAIAERGLTRRSFLNGTPPGFMTRLFELDAPGETLVVDAQQGVIVARLDAITQPGQDDPAVTAQAEAVADRAGQGMALDIFTVFSQAVQAETEVVIDQAAINAVHANFQ